MASAVTSTRPTIFPSLHADFLLNTSTTSQPHCSHVQPQRRGDGPPEPSKSGPAAFRMHLLQAAVSIFFFFSFPRHILARSVAKLTVLHQSRESPTRKSHAFFFFFFSHMAVHTEVCGGFCVCSLPILKQLHLANFGNNILLPPV